MDIYTDKQRAAAETSSLETSELLIQVDSTGRLCFANEAASSLLTHWGLQVGETLTESWRLVVNKLDPKRAGPVQQLVCEDNSKGTEYKLLFKHSDLAGLIDISGSQNDQNSQSGPDIIQSDTSCDDLTNLPNRALFLDRLEHSALVARRNRSMMPVFILGLDDFKAINETFGHVIGDKLLSAVAERLQRMLRDSDTIARLGGDEFGIIQLNPLSHEGITILAQKLLESFDKTFIVNGIPMRIGASIGISVFPNDSLDTNEILRNANMALDRCKSEESGKYRFFIARMNDEAQHLRTMIADMRNGLDNDEFEIHYQPKLDTKTRRIKGMEALVRWNHPVKGFMSPGEFIPISETTRLIIPLGQWVLREACKQTKNWNDKGYGPLKVAVNLSVVQFQDPGLLAQVQDVLSETGLDPSFLELEITEGVALEDAEQAINKFYALRELGVAISIDDFGTGYSCLSYIKSFPIQRIKIDKAFVDDIETPGNQGAIAQAVITLGQSFGMDITAEGVENETQLGFLKAGGCDEIQGYLISKPLPTAKFEEFIKGYDDTPTDLSVDDGAQQTPTLSQRFRNLINRENLASRWLQSKSVRPSLTLK